MKEIVKLSFLMLVLCTLTLQSCKEDCIEQTWYQDVDGDGLGNPDVSQMDCEQPIGYVADNTDSSDCITSLFYEDFDGDGLGNPDKSVEACEQPEGFVEDNTDELDRAATIVLFDELETLTATPGDWEVIFDKVNGKFKDAVLNGGSSDGITAQVGDNYITYINEDDMETGQARFFYEKENGAIDLSDFSDPHINFWLHTGSDASNVMAIDFDVRDSVRHAENNEDGNLSTFFTWEQDQGDADLDTDTESYESLANSGVIDKNTEGEWKLYSIPLSAANWMLAGNTSASKVGIDDISYISRLRINLDLSSTIPVGSDTRPGTFVIHIDEISISDGPAN